MAGLPQRQDAVVAQPVRTAPHHHVAVLERQALRLVCPSRPAEQEHRGDAERHRDDRLTEIPLVAVLMQGQPRSRLVAIDQAGVRREAAKTGVNRIIRADGTEELLSGTATVKLDAGDTVVIETPGGGGYGKRDGQTSRG